MTAGARAARGADLVTWYRRHGRELPWRRDPTPYRVWVSEIMLQQTTVAAVFPRYERFVARFPDVASLARAEESEVLTEVSGLGYYRRFRAMHRAARELVEKGVKDLPRSLAEIRALPGIGDYTAGAISAIAFDEPVAAVDGNALRI
ncbi:MAG: A/G-specific adenine glycosylase, partial [Planctomycetes bacterium]|nr:A/G-specific adenine glycosylase [Planctomycetota bacterium]